MRKRSFPIAVPTSRKHARPAAASTRRTFSVAAAAMETLETRQLMTAAFQVGIGINDGSSSFMNAATPKLQALGVQTVRLYLSADFNNHSWSGVLQRAVDYSARGFDVMLDVTPENGTVYSYSAVQGWFSWAVGNSSLKNAVDRWEIGNEPDHSNYWKGTMASYVPQLLQPAYQVLHAAGEQVVSAGPSWNTADVQTMINNGLLNNTDYIGYHPYADGVSLVETRLSQIKAVVQGRKPLVASEWNVRGLESNPSAWAAADAQVYKDIASTFAINYYYAAEKVDSPAGPAGIMYSNGSANQPFYNAFASLQNRRDVDCDTGNDGTRHDDACDDDACVDDHSGDVDPTAGNTAASGNGSISGVVFNDDDADGVFDSTESGGVRTVFLDTNGNGKLDAGETSVQSAADGTFKISGLAAGKYNITRVFPAGYHLSNNSGTDMVVTVNPGQAVTHFYIGSTNKSVSTPAPATVTPVTTTPVTATPATPTTPVVTSATGPSFSNLKFVTKTGVGLAGLTYITGDKTIALSSLSTLDIAAAMVVGGGSKSAKLTFNSTTTIDDSIGYTFLPELNDNFTTFHATKGTYTFTATAYSGTDATGTAGATKVYHITFI